jgi:hypothetical protein
MSKIKNRITNVKKDSNYDIDREMKALLKDYKFYFRKLFKSFPGVSFNIPSSEELVTTITKTLNNFDTKRHKKHKDEKELKK